MVAWIHGNHPSIKACEFLPKLNHIELETIQTLHNSLLHPHTCKVSRKYSNAFSSYSAKTKRDGQTDRRTDGWTGGISISPIPGLGGAAGDKYFL